MKNSVQLLMAILFLSLLQSCTKDQNIIEETPQEFEKGLINAEVADLQKAEPIEIGTIEKNDITAFDGEMMLTKGVTEKSGKTRFYSDDRSVNSKNSRYYTMKRSHMGNHTIQIELETQSGDADLYIYGVNGNQRRLIKKSKNKGTQKDVLTISKNELRQNEEKVLIRVYGYKSSYYHIHFYKVNGTSSHHCSDPHQIITKIKHENDCDYNPYKLYQILYNGKPAFFLDGEPMNHIPDLATDFIYDCDGKIIASNGFVAPNYMIDYHKISHKVLVYKCSGVCKNILHIVGDLKEEYKGYCNNNKCTVKIYSAKYRGIPAVYVSLQCEDLLDVGGGVYDCAGNIIAGESFGSNPIVDPSKLEKIELLWKCTSQTNCKKYTEDFEGYNKHKKIGPQSHKWTTWSGVEGGNEDGNIHRSGSGNQSLYIYRDNIQDVIYNLGNRNSGKYDLSFKIWVSGSGYFNIQRSENNRVSGGVLGVNFGTNGRATIKTNGGGQANVTYGKNRWVEVKMSCDFDNDNFSITIGGKKLTVRTAQHLELGAINFYAIEHAKFYIDNIVLKEKC